MAYFVCFVFSFSLFYFAEKNKEMTKTAFWLLSSILILYWTLLIGLQYDVGTDYRMFYQMFYSVAFAESQHALRNNNEPLFFSIATFVASSGLPPQSGFIIMAFIKSSLFFIFLRIFKMSNMGIFILLFFTVSTIFVNQTNGIRQATAAYIFSLSTYFIIKKQLVPFVAIVFIASMFHRSALFMLPIYFLPFLTKAFKERHFVIILFSSLLISTIDIVSLLEPLIRLTPYSRFLYTERFLEPLPILNRITRYVFIPFFLLSLRSLGTLNELETKMFHLGFIFFCMRLIFISVRIFDRLSMYFELLQIFPLYFMLIYFMNTDQEKKYNRVFVVFIFLVIVIGMQAGRTLLFPAREYIYRSVLFL